MLALLIEIFGWFFIVACIFTLIADSIDFFRNLF